MPLNEATMLKRSEFHMDIGKFIWCNLGLLFDPLNGDLTNSVCVRGCVVNGANALATV